MRGAPTHHGAFARSGGFRGPPLRSGPLHPPYDFLRRFAVPQHPSREHAVKQRLHQRRLEEVLAFRVGDLQAERPSRALRTVSTCWVPALEWATRPRASRA